ncbi:MAG: cyclic nucleotide-binding domain-containing protein [Burkholderiales bacterium]|nr:cyclic nucleotide-binding domain-containing protein [Burkholderiales bacterium]
MQARALDAREGGDLLAALWSGGRLEQAFDAGALRRLAGYLQFARVGAGRRLIVQDEPGDFMLIVLEGRIGVERVPDVGTPSQIVEAHAGDVLGDMALLDDGPRFSTCTTRSECGLAVLETEALARLMREDPHLALVLMAALARRLSLRVRRVSARLSALLSDA